ncbi:MAG: cell wall hydrolase [Rhodospirillales bacterium]
MTEFLLVYAGLGVILWAVVKSEGEGSGSPLQASAAPQLAETVAIRGAASRAAAEPTGAAAARSARWLNRPGADLNREFECLALNIYHEARSEPALGQFAVAAVTLNRVAAAAFPDSICAVVQQGGEDRLHRCQFSWWCDGKSDTPTNERAWAKARFVAYTVLFFDPPDPTHGALWYHADYVDPHWASAFTRMAKIGRHIFYRQPQGLQRASAG